MMPQIAVGDAYGAGYEFVKSPPPNNLSGYVRHPRHAMITGGTGRYTDDTQMSIGVAEAMLEDRLSVALLADKWVSCFKRDPREGYTPSFYTFLCEISDGEEFRSRIRPNSDKSGACMRVLPVCLLPGLGDVLHWAEKQARVTHDTRDGVDAAKAVAATGWYFRNRVGDRMGLGEWLARELDGRWGCDWAKPKVSVRAVDCAHAAIHLVRTSGSMSEILRRSVDLTGDVDTVAAIACGIGSMSEGTEQDAPQVLYDNLENGDYGLDYLKELDRRLGEKYPLR